MGVFLEESGSRERRGAESIDECWARVPEEHPGHRPGEGVSLVVGRPLPPLSWREKETSVEMGKKVTFVS